jgi:hypothetical protein
MQRADAMARPAALATGFAALDAVLPGSGWPLGAITELMPDTVGIGELSLMLPALCALAQAGRHLACISPPHLPYPPALVQAGLPLERLLIIHAGEMQHTLWAAEQLLRCVGIGAVLMWPDAITEPQLRRLQLAAESSGGFGLVYRPAQAAASASPAALRLRLHAAHDGLRIEIKKVRGGHAHALVVHPAAAA